MTNKELNAEGIHFDLDQTTKAYGLAGVEKCWLDYAYDDGREGWDQDAYYADFDKWWVKLPKKEKERIYKEMGR